MVIKGAQLDYFEIRRRVERFLKSAGIRAYCRDVCQGGCCGGCTGCFNQEKRRLYCSLFMCSSLDWLLGKWCPDFGAFRALRYNYTDAEAEMRCAVGESFCGANHLAATRPPMAVFKILRLPEELVAQGSSATLVEQVRRVTALLMQHGERRKSRTADVREPWEKVNEILEQCSL